MTAEGKNAAMNGMNATGIQLPFDTTFISVSLMEEWVFSKRKLAFGALLVAGL